MARTRLEANCLSCSTTFTFLPSCSEGKFCSNKCQQDFRFFKETLPAFERGEVVTGSSLKRCMRHTKGYICECGNAGRWLNKPLVLQLDHIDGNSDNNHPLNLRWLCPNCHSQTPTWSNRLRQVKPTRRNKYIRKRRRK